MTVFIKFTRADDVPVWIRADSVVRISRVKDRADVNTMIFCSDGVVQDVKEWPEDVVKKIEAASADPPGK